MAPARSVNDRNYTGFKKYGKGPIHWKDTPEAFQKKPRCAVIASHVSPQDILLDLGCGDGTYACALARLCRSVVGIDGHAGAIGFANAMKEKYKVPNCSFFPITISQVPRKLRKMKRTFQIVYAMDVIEHLPYPEELLQVGQKMVAHAGLILIGTPLFVSKEQVSRYHVKEYTVEEMRSLVGSYMDTTEEHMLPFQRKDGILYEKGYYVSVARLRKSPHRKAQANDWKGLAKRVAAGVDPRVWLGKVRHCIAQRRWPYGFYKCAHWFRHHVWAPVRGVFRWFLPYRGKYLISYWRYRISRIRYQTMGPPEYDLVFVLKKKAPGWVLDGICREMARYGSPRHFFHYTQSGSSLPDSRAYFFSHHSFFGRCLRSYPFLWGRPLLLFYTHPREGQDNKRRELIHAINRCEAARVVCMNSQGVRDFVREGLMPEKVTWVLAGADPDFFQPHERNHGAVGLSTAFYPRKSPDLILEIIRSMPHRKFILLGPASDDEASAHRRWNQFKYFDELIALPNLTYIEAPYADYPKYYAQMDVLLSPSKVEGGPIPLIEAMMGNIVPVASRTGFAPDIIRHGENGYLFDVDSSPEVICEVIEKAFRFPGDIRVTAAHLTWKRFSGECFKLLGLEEASASNECEDKLPSHDHSPGGFERMIRST